MPAEASTSLLTVFLLGVSLGLTACAVTCLPFIGTLTFGKAAGRQSGLVDMALFLGGRLAAYTVLGGLAGLLGASFVKVLAVNPKVLVLFLALYPNFVVSAQGRVTAQLLTLSATLIDINVAWQAPLAWGAHQLRSWLLRPKITTAIARTASAVLIAFAALLLYDHFL